MPTLQQLPERLLGKFQLQKRNQGTMSQGLSDRGAPGRMRRWHLQPCLCLSPTQCQRGGFSCIRPFWSEPSERQVLERALPQPVTSHYLVNIHTLTASPKGLECNLLAAWIHCLLPLRVQELYRDSCRPSSFFLGVYNLRSTCWNEHICGTHCHIAVTLTWSNSMALGVTLWECVHTRGHACACVYVCTGDGKLSHLLWVISKLHKSFLHPPRVCHVPPIPPWHLNSTPREDKVTDKRGQRKAGNRIVCKSLPHPLFWDRPSSHQIVIQHLLCFRHCAQHWECSSDQNQT